MLDRSEEYTRMAQAEQRLWWYAVLHRLVADALQRLPPTSDPIVCDAGCGTGGLLLYLRAAGYQRAEGFDISKSAVAVCDARRLPVRRAGLLELARVYQRGTLDAVVSNDTLYFLDTPSRADFLEQCADVLRPGGLLILNVPALHPFRGSHDVCVGIARRFARGELEGLLRDRPFAIEDKRYWPVLLSPLILAARWMQRLRMAASPDRAYHADVAVPPAWINALLLRATLSELRAPFRIPFASSLFVVCRRT